jgi:uncharacterized protein
MAEPNWRHYRHPEVRELAWSLFSPSLAHFDLAGDSRPWQLQWDEEAHHILCEADKRPAPLREVLSRANDRRLGARFELLWQFFLQQHSFYELIAANVQIHEADRTLGALDFLIHDGHHGCTVHLELAVKFYLYASAMPATEPSAWIGPNPDDDFGQKIRHLWHHQLALSTSETVLKFIAGEGWPTPDKRVALMKGYLFSPLDQEVDMGPPACPSYLRGRWLRGDQLGRIFDRHANDSWAIVDKEQWLDPMPALHQRVDDVARCVDALFSKGNTSLMLVVSPESGLPERAGRYFVMPDRWPATGRGRQNQPITRGFGEAQH